MKYIQKLFLMAVLLVGVSAFYGCGNDDENYPNGTIAVGMATVERPPQYDAPYFVLDNGKKMWVVQTLVPYKELKSGERIFGSFSLLQPGEDGFEYNIRLNEYTMVPVQDVLDLNVENADSIGNDAVQLRNIWPAADYLNVRFLLNYPNPQEPILNLVFNEMVPLDNDGYAHLELRYNSNGSTGRPVPGMVSFKLGKYGPANTELKGLKVLVKASGNSEKTYTFSYPLTGDATPSFSPIDIAELK